MFVFFLYGSHFLDTSHEVSYCNASVLRSWCQVLHRDIQICFYELAGRIGRSIVEAVSVSCLGPAELFAMEYALINFFLFLFKI